MKIISIDVGIKNLAYCLLESCDDKTFNILQWDVLNLCGEEPKCQCDTKKKGICNAKAKYSKGINYYCKSHARLIISLRGIVISIYFKWLIKHPNCNTTNVVTIYDN